MRLNLKKTDCHIIEKETCMARPLKKGPLSHMSFPSTDVLKRDSLSQFLIISFPPMRKISGSLVKGCILLLFIM
jgi:hypothetical protein